MAMPGSFHPARGARAGLGAGSEDDIYLSNTDTEDSDYVPAASDAIIMDEDVEGAIEGDGDGREFGVLGAFEDEDDEIDDDEDDDEDDENFLDENEFELELQGEYEDETELDDPELAEAERLATGHPTDVPSAGGAGQQSQRYTLAIDPTTQSIYIVDSEGTRQDLGLTGNGGQDEAGRTRVGLTAEATLSALRRVIGRGRPARPVAQQDDTADDDDDDDDGLFRFGYRGGRRSAEGLFPIVTEPIQAGVDLERKGLFGRPGKKFDSQPRRKFSPYYRNINDTLRDREYRSVTRPARRIDAGDAAVPNNPGVEVALCGANVYCGQYSKDGSFFYTCAKDYKIRIYDMTTSSRNKSVVDPCESQDNSAPGRRYRQMSMYSEEDKSSITISKTVQAREHLSSWTITDADLSPDNSKMIWSTIGPVVGMTRFKENADDMENLDDGDGQVSLDFGSGRYGPRRHFGIWSVRFSSDAREIVAGAGSGAIHVYDLEARQTILSIQAHDNDVNAVCFADTASSNVLVSGSDDNYLKVWDRRSLGESGRFTKPSGVLVGHTEGITFVAPKGDGRFVISNGKDQTCKLWDLRMMYSSDEFTALDRLDVSVRGFDYRYGLYKKPQVAQHPHDRSLMTYTGHTVLRTLIRCHFSPEATTGQRYIYSGSFDGKVHIWNLDGTVAQVLDRSKTIPLLSRGATSDQLTMNDASQPDRPGGTYKTTSSCPVVRDVSWAPYAPNILSSAWADSAGSVAMHEWKGYGKRQDASI